MLKIFIPLNGPGTDSNCVMHGLETGSVYNVFTINIVSVMTYPSFMDGQQKLSVLKGNILSSLYADSFWQQV